MIFFNLYTERWAAAVQGETFKQRGAYISLLVWQYANDADALPPDRKECYRISGAQTQSERDAVDHVLDTHYRSNPNSGFVQKRARSEIARFLGRDPARVVEREAERARKAASRATLRALYQLARTHGLAVRGGMSIKALRETCVAHGIELGALAEVPPLQRLNGHRHESQGVVTGVVTPVTGGVTGEVTGVHEPRTTEDSTSLHDSPVTGHRGPPEAAWDVVDDPAAPTPPATPTAAGSACRAMKRAGLIGVNPSHPDLLRLLAMGVTEAQLHDAALRAVMLRKPGFAYALAIAEGEWKASAEQRAFLAAAAPSLLS